MAREAGTGRPLIKHSIHTARGLDERLCRRTVRLWLLVRGRFASQLVRLVPHHDRLRFEADEYIVWVVQYLNEPRIPLPQLPHVTSKQPLHTISVMSFEARLASEADVMDSTCRDLKVHHPDGAAQVLLNPFRERVGLIIPDNPECALLPQKPDGRLARAVLGRG